MRIDPEILLKQLLDQHLKTIKDWVIFANLQRNNAAYQNALKAFQFEAIAASNDPYQFIENRINRILKQYDEQEKELGETYIQIIRWFAQNQIADIVVKTAMQTALTEATQDISTAVKQVNDIANLFLKDCLTIGYTGAAIAYLEYLRDLKPKEVIAFVKQHF